MKPNNSFILYKFDIFHYDNKIYSCCHPSKGTISLKMATDKLHQIYELIMVRVINYFKNF